MAVGIPYIRAGLVTQAGRVFTWPEGQMDTGLFRNKGPGLATFAFGDIIPAFGVGDGQQVVVENGIWATSALTFDAISVVAGANINGAAASRANDYAVVDTAVPHGLADGDLVLLSGWTPSSFNVIEPGAVVQVLSPTRFTFPQHGADGVAGGLGIVSRPAAVEIIAWQRKLRSRTGAVPSLGATGPAAMAPSQMGILPLEYAELLWQGYGDQISVRGAERNCSHQLDLSQYLGFFNDQQQVKALGSYGLYPTSFRAPLLTPDNYGNVGMNLWVRSGNIQGVRAYSTSYPGGPTFVRVWTNGAHHLTTGDFVRLSGWSPGYFNVDLYVFHHPRYPPDLFDGFTGLELPNGGVSTSPGIIQALHSHNLDDQQARCYCNPSPAYNYYNPVIVDAGPFVVGPVPALPPNQSFTPWMPFRLGFGTPTPYPGTFRMVSAGGMATYFYGSGRRPIYNGMMVFVYFALSDMTSMPWPPSVNCNNYGIASGCNPSAATFQLPTSVPPGDYSLPTFQLYAPLDDPYNLASVTANERVRIYPWLDLSLYAQPGTHGRVEFQTGPCAPPTVQNCDTNIGNDVLTVIDSSVLFIGQSIDGNVNISPFGRSIVAILTPTTVRMAAPAIATSVGVPTQFPTGGLPVPGTETTWQTILEWVGNNAAGDMEVMMNYDFDMPALMPPTPFKYWRLRLTDLTASGGGVEIKLPLDEGIAVQRSVEQRQSQFKLPFRTGRRQLGSLLQRYRLLGYQPEIYRLNWTGMQKVDPVNPDASNPAQNLYLPDGPQERTI